MKKIDLSHLARDPKATVAFIDTMGEAFSKGGLPNCGTLGMGKMVALTLLMEGMSPLAFQLQYDLMKGGKISRKSGALLADYEASGGGCIWENLGDSGDEAKARFVYGVHDLVISYTIQDAERQIPPNQFKDKTGNWQKNPGSMLRARLVTKALRIVAPGIVAGIYTADELGFDDEGLTHEEMSDPPQSVVEEAASSGKKRGTKTSKTPSTKSSKGSKATAKPAKPSKKSSSQEEVDAAIEEGARKDLEEKGKKLNQDNDAEINKERDESTGETPSSKDSSDTSTNDAADNEDAGLPPDLCTNKQLATLKELVIELDFKDKFDAALEKINVDGAKNLTRKQAEKWIARLEEVKAAS